MAIRVAALPGDGIGVEVMDQGLKVLAAAGKLRKVGKAAEAVDPFWASVATCVDVPKPKTPDARSTLMDAISGFNRMGLRRKSQQTPLPDASQFSPAQKEDMFSQMKRNIALIRPAIAGGDDEDSSESDWSDSDC